MDVQLVDDLMAALAAYRERAWPTPTPEPVPVTTPEPEPAPEPEPVPTPVAVAGWDLPITRPLPGLPVYSGPAVPPRGAVISGYTILTPLEVSNPDVTIEDCLIRPRSTTPANNLVQVTAPGCRIARCEVDGSALPATSGWQHRAFVYALSFKQSGGPGRVEDVWVHDVGKMLVFAGGGDLSFDRVRVEQLVSIGDPSQPSGSHNECIHCWEGFSGTLACTDCWFNGDTKNSSGAIMLQNKVAAASFTRCLFSGGAYAFHNLATGAVAVNDCRWEKPWFYGAVRNQNRPQLWTGNRMLDRTQADAAGAEVRA